MSSETRAFASAASDGSVEAAELVALVALIGDRLQLHFDEINVRMSEIITQQIDHLDDPELSAMLYASVEGNVSTILHIIRNDIPLEHMQPITAATEYALRLAQRGVPASSLRRAYHFGSDDLMAWFFEEVRQLDCSEELKLRLLRHLAGFVHKYIDWITRVVLEAHEEERRLWLDRSASVTASLVARVLDRQVVNATEFETWTGYRLDQRHVGAVIWIDGANAGTDQTGPLEQFARGLAARLGSGERMLFTAVDRSTAWVWFGRGGDARTVDVAAVQSALTDVADSRVAFGMPVHGPAGFRRTHDQAEAARQVGIASSSAVTNAVGYGDQGVAVTAMLSRDLESTRTWIIEVLGPLARDDAASAQMRETLRVFLGTGGSYAQTSERLLLHRNTVKYRLGKAEKIRGRALETDRLDLELALQVCRFLGSNVLDRAE